MQNEQTDDKQEDQSGNLPDLAPETEDPAVSGNPAIDDSHHPPGDPNDPGTAGDYSR